MLPQVFPTVGEAVWQLFILLTTANFPDVMMPAYAAHRAAAIFFLAFVSLGVFFLMNFLLAVIYDAYNSQVGIPTAVAIGLDIHMLGVFFLMNFLLAVIYDAYNSQV